MALDDQSDPVAIVRSLARFIAARSLPVSMNTAEVRQNSSRRSIGPCCRKHDERTRSAGVGVVALAQVQRVSDYVCLRLCWAVVVANECLAVVYTGRSKRLNLHERACCDHCLGDRRVI